MNPSFEDPIDLARLLPDVVTRNGHHPDCECTQCHPYDEDQATEQHPTKPDGEEQ